MISDKGLEFPLKGSITKADVKKAQERLLRMAVIVKEALEKGNVGYTLMFGSLLGAVRHKGFIPWDLDFDIGVMDEDYDKAMQCIEAAIPDWMVVQNRETDNNYCANWSKVRDRNTEMISTSYPGDNSFRYRGLHIDVYRLKRAGTHGYEYSFLQDNIEYYTLKRDRGLMPEKAYSEKMKEIENKMSEISSSKETENSPQSDCYFLNLFHTGVGNVFPLREYIFEDETFCGPNDYDRVLKDSYYVGDYMVPPAYDNRDMGQETLLFIDNKQGGVYKPSISYLAHYVGFCNRRAA